MRKLVLYGGAAIMAVLVVAAYFISQYPQLILPQAPGEPENVDASIRQLVEIFQEGEDIEAFSHEHGLYVQDGMVRVVIELYGEGDEAPTGYGLKVEARHGRFVQAMIPIGEVYELASSPGIRYIYAPKEPVVAS